jgi:hypothetical protein
MTEEIKDSKGNLIGSIVNGKLEVFDSEKVIDFLFEKGKGLLVALAERDQKIKELSEYNDSLKKTLKLSL